MGHSEPEYAGRPNKSEKCRACDDFKTWAKFQKGQKQESGQKFEVTFRLCCISTNL